MISCIAMVIHGYIYVHFADWITENKHCGLVKIKIIGPMVFFLPVAFIWRLNSAISAFDRVCREYRCFSHLWFFIEAGRQHLLPCKCFPMLPSFVFCCYCSLNTEASSSWTHADYQWAACRLTIECRLDSSVTQLSSVHAAPLVQTHWCLMIKQARCHMIT